MADLTAAALRRQYAAGERDFKAAHLPGAEFTRAVLAELNLSDADLSGANFSEGVLTRADLTGADLTEATLNMADLAWANLAGARLPGARLSGATLQDANLKGVDLTDADLSGANLTMANLSGARLKSAKLDGANLTGANLSEADLTWSDLKGATLTRADLTGAVLDGANLTRANLDRANLRRARIREADFTGAILSDADLSDATLTDSMLTRAVLTGARLEGVSDLWVDRTYVRDAVFSPWARDLWSQLRVAYRVPENLFHLGVLAALLAPDASRALSAFHSGAPCATGDCRTVSLWEAILGGGRPDSILVPAAFVIYNALRLALAWWVGRLREGESRSGVTPPVGAYRIPGLAHRFVMRPLGVAAVLYALARVVSVLGSSVTLPV